MWNTVVQPPPSDVVRPPPPYPTQPSVIQHPPPSPAFSYNTTVRGPRFIAASQQQQNIMTSSVVSGSKPKPIGALPWLLTLGPAKSLHFPETIKTGYLSCLNNILKVCFAN